jgi:multicomponent Na+:H+ antiporter subunit E
MSSLALNVFLAIVWMLVQASFSSWSLLIGLFFGFLSITIVELVQGRRDYVLWVNALLRLTLFFLVDLIRSNIILARDILRPVPRFEPALLRIAITDLSPVSTVVLTNLISLTPGTLTIDAEEDGRVIYVHALYARVPDDVRKRIAVLGNLILGAAVRQVPSRERM